MSNPTFKASEVFSMINLPFSGNGYNQNAVVEYLTEYFGDHEYSSIDDMVRDLHMAHWAAGSFGLIYYSEQAEFLNDSRNRDDIEEVIAHYAECTGEAISVREFSDMLVIALDVAVNEIASAIEYADLQVIVHAVDYLDTNPEVIICERIEADDTLAEIIQHRLDMEVQHSTTWLNSDELMAMEEQIAELIYVVD
jgi:hypothetical protein